MAKSKIYQQLVKRLVAPIFCPPREKDFLFGLTLKKATKSGGLNRKKVV